MEGGGRGGDDIVVDVCLSVGDGCACVCVCLRACSSTQLRASLSQCAWF